MRYLAFVSLVVVLLGAAISAQHSAMPPGISHEEHLRLIQKEQQLRDRGLLAMGFDQDAVAHHFLLRTSGGSIEVTVKDGRDAKALAQVRSHLREIATLFAAGSFEKPLATHAEMPPGAERMRANTDRIRYRYEERSNGGAVIVETQDPSTLEAIHEFLRYQIVEHNTGDPLTPTP
jgi:hypothetical protein